MKSIFSALTALLALFAGNSYAAYAPVGVQNNVNISTVLQGGWTECYLATMDVSIGTYAENVLNQCNGTNIMMAGRATGSDTLLVLAETTLADATFATGKTSATHISNGAKWYFNSDWSWGFADLSNTPNLNSCDTEANLNGMCLHTVSFTGGYRIGNIAGLNGSTAYEKIFFVNNGDTVPEPGVLSLLGICLAGALTLRRSKKSR